jgi:hypothetical protein
MVVVPARQATQHRLAKSIPWNRFLGSLKVLKYRLSIQVNVLVDQYSSFEKKITDRTVFTMSANFEYKFKETPKYFQTFSN